MLKTPPKQVDFSQFDQGEDIKLIQRRIMDSDDEYIKLPNLPKLNSSEYKDYIKYKQFLKLKDLKSLVDLFYKSSCIGRFNLNVPTYEIELSDKKLEDINIKENRNKRKYCICRKYYNTSRYHNTHTYI